MLKGVLIYLITPLVSGIVVTLIGMSLVKIEPANENSARLSPGEAISARHAKASPL